MSQCQWMADCGFFEKEMPNMPVLAGMYQRQFCRGDSTRCARCMVRSALGKEAVPPRLYPNQIEQAKALINVVGQPLRVAA